MAAQSRDVVEVILPQAFCADHSQVSRAILVPNVEIRVED